MLDSLLEVFDSLWHMAKQFGLELMIILSVCFLGYLFSKRK